MTTLPQLLTVNEVAVQLRVSRRTVYREISEGRLRVFHVRGKTLVELREVMAYLAHRRAA